MSDTAVEAAGFTTTNDAFVSNLSPNTNPAGGTWATEWKFNVKIPTTGISGSFDVTLPLNAWQDKAGNTNARDVLTFSYDKTLDDCEMKAGRELSTSTATPTVGIEVAYGKCVVTL
eukprot:GDKK01042663.1.p2 GENE.GDKK01042663.1~~GDKK01042663.1.p2  ORF type:complete len:129 (-),score=31.11 GDKK01042663.1:525-872(-)